MTTVLRRILSLTLALCLCLAMLPTVAPRVKALTPTYTVSSAYASSSYYDALCDVTLTGNQRDDIINVALSQVGYREGSYTGDYSGAYDASYNNYTEYNYWYHNHVSSGMPVGGSYAHWCATFVSWCAEQANVPSSILKRSTAAGHSYSYFNLNFYSGSSTLASSSDNDSYFKGYNYTPKKGDLFYTRSWSHVGLVVSVNGSYVTTVEGNTNNDGSADGFGVYVRSRAISSLYFGVPEYQDAVHTCDRNGGVTYGSSHPHYASYKCSVCGEITTDTSVTNVSSSCVTCQQPEKPALLSLNTNYGDGEAIFFEWNATDRTTHYNLILETANAQGAWELYEQIPYAASGMSKVLPLGQYRCKLQSCNSDCQTEDGSDYLHTDGDYSYFTVSTTYYTITFDGNGGFSPIASRTLLIGQPVGELHIPQRYGYEFVGWYLNAEGTGNPVSSTSTFDTDITLYARWDNAVVTPTLTLSYPTLSFRDEIQYNIYFTADNITSVEEMGLALYAYRNTSGTIANAIETVPGYVANANGSYTVRSNGIPARQLGDTVYFKVYAKLTDGSYVYSGIVGYHAVAYANSVLNNSSSSAKAKSLVVAMLNYGAAAQTYFNYKTGSLMNANLTAEQKALVQDYDSSMVQEVVNASASKAAAFVSNGGYSKINPAVSFEGAFSINYYFTPKYTPSDGITFYYWTADAYSKAGRLTTSNASGSVNMTSTNGIYSATVEGIAARQIDETIYIAAIYTSGGTVYTTNVIAYSLGAYCKTIAANGTPLGGATAAYGYYAKAYFAS